MTGGRPGAPKITLAPRKVQLSPNVRVSPRVTNLRPGTFNAPMATLPAQTDPFTGGPTTSRVQAAPGQTRMTMPGGVGQAPNPTGPTTPTQLSPGGQILVPVSPTTNQQQQAKVSQAGAVGKPVASVAPMVRTSTTANTPLTAQTSTPNWLRENAAAQISPIAAKCKYFFSTLIRLASDEPDHDANRVKMLIQALIDDTIQPEEFHNQLHIALNSNPQPVLVPFLKKSLPYLRYSLMVEEFQIEGVRAPPSNAFMLISPDTHIGTGTHTGMGPHTLTPQVGLQSFGGPRPQITQQLPLITPPGRQLRPNMYESHEPLITPPGYQFGPNLYDSHVPRITAPGQPLRLNHYETYEPLMMPLGQQLGPNYYGTHEPPITPPGYQLGPNLYESHEPFITPSGQQLRPNLYESYEPLITSPGQQLGPELYEYYEPFMPSRFSPYFRQMPLERMYFPPYPQSRPTILTRNSGYNFPNRQSNAPYYI